MYLLLFDYPSAQNITYPFHEAIRNISLGYYLDNLETLFLPFWLIGTFIKIMVFLYLLAYIFSKIVKIDEFEHLLFPLAVIVLLTGMIPENAAVNVYTVGKTLFNYSSYFFLIYLVLLWIFAKGRKLI
ncbi:hypothetical protein Q75_03380 [Bacillus coahuilensis p1.1.43]|uniref:Uncharacterized protein n=1 Tax=Bacillus coahuilensis p1.1.43 TaxID=1150625 RepID=A0A147KB45_9BACI|nr:hypothetical protein Q75_03380 [Bacillus coahuilensis p1.1.43]